MYYGALKEGLLLWQRDGRTSATSPTICFARLGSHEVGVWCEYPSPIATSSNDSWYVHQAVIEHENLGRTIVTGLCDVADALPRVEVAAYLYPTNTVKQAVSVLYALIIKFLLRALEWYEEGKFAHAIHSITKPAALRYDDLLEDIGRATRRIADLAVTSSQAELRDMHHKLRALTSSQAELRDMPHELRALTLVVEQLIRRIADLAVTSSQAEQRDMHHELRAPTLMVKQHMLLDQSLKASTLLEYRHTLSDIQFEQALVRVSSACSVDHKSTLQASLLLRDKHRFVSHRTKCPPFWLSSELHAWNVSQHSSSINLRAPFKNRFYLRDFCANVIEELHNARVAVLWVLKPMEQTYHSVAEILKSLIHQALTLDHTSRTDSIVSFQLRRFLDAHSDSDFINLLGSCLQPFKLVYIMVDIGVMEPFDASQCKRHLQELSQRLSEGYASTILKFMALSYGPGYKSPQEKDSLLLKVGNQSRRKGKKLPSEPLQRVAARASGRQQMHRGRSNSTMPFRAPGRTLRTEAD